MTDINKVNIASLLSKQTKGELIVLPVLLLGELTWLKFIYSAGGDAAESTARCVCLRMRQQAQALGEIASL